MPNLYGPRDWERFFPQENPHKWRSEIARDYGRVIHSACFRRLQGKTQVFPTAESDFFRNRLTHSLEVSQIAQAIAERLNATYRELDDQKLDCKLCGIAALIHDIGHPPFGHHGERALDNAMKEYGGFEGNAQNLRIVGRLEKKISNVAQKRKPEDGVTQKYGLNLCYRTLASVLKYDKEIPLLRKPEDKLVKGQYTAEAERVQVIKAAVLGDVPCREGEFKTVECWIMDVADDIAYSTYDLEDCLKAGFLTPLQIVSSDNELLDRVAEKVTEALGRSISRIEVNAELIKIFRGITDGLKPSDSDMVKIIQAAKNSRYIAEDSSSRTQLSAQLVNDAVNSTVLEFDKERPMLSKVRLNPDSALRVEVLKQYTYIATISSARVKLAEYKGTQIVTKIFEALSEKKGSVLMPEDVRR